MVSWDKMARQFQENKQNAIEIERKKREEKAIKKPLLVDIEYNYQLDNQRFPNISPGSQCGYTSCAMILSRYIPTAKSDAFVAEMVRILDKEFIAAQTKVRKGAFQVTYSNFITSEFSKRKLPYRAITFTHGGKFEDIENALEFGSGCMISTMLTSFGHYLVIVGIDYEKESFICHDPFGRFDFSSNEYAETKRDSGKSVLYPIKELSEFMNRSSKVAMNRSGFRFIRVGNL